MIRRIIDRILSYLSSYDCSREAVQRRCLQTHLDKATEISRW